MKRTNSMIAVALTTALVIPAASVATASTAQAALVGGQIAHASPDNGLDTAIGVQCDRGSLPNVTLWIREGEDSDDRCRAAGAQEDVEKVWVGHNEQIVCQGARTGWTIRWDANRWHNVGDFENERCVKQED